MCLITLGSYIFRHRFLCLFNHVFDALSNGISFFSYLSTSKLWWLFTLGTAPTLMPDNFGKVHFYAQFYAFFCPFLMLYPTVSTFSIFADFYFGVFFRPVSHLFCPHFQPLMRLQPCYAADSWHVLDNETLETKIATSSNMGTLSVFIFHLLQILSTSGNKIKNIIFFLH